MITVTMMMMHGGNFQHQAISSHLVTYVRATVSGLFKVKTSVKLIGAKFTRPAVIKSVIFNASPCGSNQHLQHDSFRPSKKFDAV